MTSLALTTPQQQDGTRYVRGFLPFAPLKYSPQQPRYVGSTDDASRALLHGSEVSIFAKPCQGCGQSPLRALIITFSLLFASSTLAQQPAAGPLDGSWIAELREARADLKEHRDAIRESAAEAREWGERLDRIDRFERRDREGRVQFGSRIATFLDRVERIFWLVVVVAVVALIAFGLACAAYGVERMSAGAKSVLGVVKSLADAVKAWRGGK